MQMKYLEVESTKLQSDVKVLYMRNVLLIIVRLFGLKRRLNNTSSTLMPFLVKEQLSKIINIQQRPLGNMNSKM
jgi:hypothetical protein